MISKLRNFAATHRCTLLGIGPMSKNCVDAAIELSQQYNIPVMLIASRRQIESSELGGGYVNNWSTEEYVRYVRNKDTKEMVLLARDHGGPWQSDLEKEEKVSYNQAMETARKSYEIDIKHGFNLIHIDPTTDIFKKLSIDDILERIYELYDFCWSIAKDQTNEIGFEISTGKEDSGVDKPFDVQYVLSNILNFCKKKETPKPQFLVVRTGNQVMETQNVGRFETIFKKPDIVLKNQILDIIKICNKYGVMIKEHNTDYLDGESLAQHPMLGIHAANVAPEFGVSETRAFLSLLKKNNLDTEFQQFIEIAYSSNKWKKWILPYSSTGKLEKAIIAGHYVFSSPEFLEIKEKVEKKLELSESLDEYLKSKVKLSILRYLKLFKLI